MRRLVLLFVLFTVVRAVPVKKNPSLLIVSTSMGEGSKYCDLTEKNQRDYASMHGYEYVRYHERDRPSLSMEVNDNPKWGKLHSLVTEMGKPYEWVVWMDGDMVVTNKKKTFEGLMEEYKVADKSLLVTHDSYCRQWPSEATINSGILVLRNNDWSKSLVHDVLKKGKVPGSNLVDQPRFISELKERNELNMPCSSVDSVETHGHTAVLPQRTMNSFLRDGYGDSEEARWHQGDFIAHVTGMGTPDRQTKIKSLLSHLEEDIFDLFATPQSTTHITGAPGDLWRAEMIKALTEENWDRVEELM